jgi:chaperone LolA
LQIEPVEHAALALALAKAVAEAAQLQRGWRIGNRGWGTFGHGRFLLLRRVWRGGALVTCGKQNSGASAPSEKETDVKKMFSGLLAGLALLAGAAQADGVARLQKLTGELKSFQAGFVQTLYDADSNPVQESRGAVILKRPGRFRWDYTEPYPQQIVADGEKLWIYDTELAQVTVKPIDQALGSAPILLLSSNKPLGEEFDLRDLGSREGLEWVELTPKVQDTDFNKVYLGLDGRGISVMELRDSFGQATQIRFNDFELNVDAPEKLFKFTPPAGVDVIGAEQ